MNFVLIAMLLATGISEPVLKGYYNQKTFESKAACEAFIQTDEGKQVTEKIKKIADEKELTAQFSCQEKSE